jgi:hypothetical protein
MWENAAGFFQYRKHHCPSEEIHCPLFGRVREREAVDCDHLQEGEC